MMIGNEKAVCHVTIFCPERNNSAKQEQHFCSWLALNECSFDIVTVSPEDCTINTDDKNGTLTRNESEHPPSTHTSRNPHLRIFNNLLQQDLQQQTITMPFIHSDPVDRRKRRHDVRRNDRAQTTTPTQYDKQNARYRSRQDPDRLWYFAGYFYKAGGQGYA